MAATEMYTRGQPGEADNRGESLVCQLLSPAAAVRGIAFQTCHALQTKPRKGVQSVHCLLLFSVWHVSSKQHLLDDILSQKVHAVNHPRHGVIIRRQEKVAVHAALHNIVIDCTLLQVQRHMDLMQQQKEAAAMDKLRQLMPQLGDMVRALALSKAEWDIDKAVAMLRSFQVSHLDKVNTLNKVGKCAAVPLQVTGSSSPCLLQRV